MNNTKEIAKQIFDKMTPDGGEGFPELWNKIDKEIYLKLSQIEKEEIENEVDTLCYMES